MRVLVTGATGQLGRALAASAPAGVEVLAAARDQLDLLDGDVGARVSDLAPDLILNAAAYTAVDKAEEDAALAQRINGDAVAELAATGIRLVHVSTDYVLPGDRAHPARPDDPVGPLGAYGRTKLEGEQAALAAGALVVRTAWVYAAEGKNFVHAMLGRMKQGTDLRVVADQIGTPTHAASLARALWSLAKVEATGLHHFTDAGVASWYDFAVAISEEGRALGLFDHQVAITPIPTEDYPTPAARPAYSVLDCHTTWAITGVPRHWRDELRSMLRELGEGEAGHG